MTHADQLTRTLANLAALPLGLEQRRQRLIDEVAKIVCADVQYWAWGRGHPKNGPPTPLGLIQTGFSPEQMAIFVEAAMEPETDRLFRIPMIPRLNPQATWTRGQLINSDDWHATYLYRQHWRRMKLDEWMMSVRYCANDTWVQLYFAKETGAPPFDENDRELVDLVMRNVNWLYPATTELIPPEAFAPLTARQRGVLLLLLDGLSRREVADAMSISENTVNDHVKAIYRHFGVTSMGQLAAHFLRESGQNSENH